MATTSGLSITEKVTFAALPTATFTHAKAPYFNTVVTDSTGGSVKVGYDLRGVRGADGGELIVSDIDRAAAACLHRPGHRRPRHQDPAVGDARVRATSRCRALQGAGTYGLALRATSHGTELNGLDGAIDSTSAWIPCA